MNTSELPDKDNTILSPSGKADAQKNGNRPTAPPGQSRTRPGNRGGAPPRHHEDRRESSGNNGITT
jgi:hypothetical protein